MNIKQDVQQQFGKNAASFVSSSTHKEGKDLLILVEMSRVRGDEILLDVATGGGHTAIAFSPLVKQIIAVDITQEILKAAKTSSSDNNITNIQFVVGDAEDLPFSDERFDIVTCRLAPHHFPDVNKFIQEVHRVLKPGGQFLLDDNVAPEDDDFDHFYNAIEKMRDFSHVRALKKTEWLRMLELSGFYIEEWRRFEKFFQFESWCDRVQLPASEKEELTRFMIQSAAMIKTKFAIMIEANQIVSFTGEAIVLKATRT